MATDSSAPETEVLRNRAQTGPRVVEFFTAIRDWPSSRKSALLYGIALILHCVGTMVSPLFLSRLDWVDSNLVLTVLWAWNAQLALSFLISLFVALKGREGYWTLWLNVIPYGIFLIVFIALFGVASTAITVWYPSVILLVAVWYSPRDGLYAFVYGMVLISIYALLLNLGKVPYAPALLERAIDVQSNAWWTAYVFILSLTYFAFCFALVSLLFWTQRIQQGRLHAAQAGLERSVRAIGRYVPAQLADQIARGEQTEPFKPERVRLTLVVSRIVDLAEVSDSLDAEQTSELLNEYLMTMARIADANEGTISQLAGEGIQIFFGAPQASTDKDHALRAVSMALSMQQAMSDLRREWENRGIRHPWQVRIGINTGHVSVGDFGSEGRKSYSAIGIQAIIAARLQSRCGPGEVCVSDTTWGLVMDHFSGQDKGALQLPGLHFPIHAYRITGRVPSKPNESLPRTD